MQKALACCIIFDFLDLILEVFNINATVVFWYRSKFVMESSVLDHSEGQMVCWRYKPHVTRVGRVSEDIQQDSQILRCSAGNGYPIVRDWILWLEEGRQPRRKVLAQTRIAMIWAVLKCRECDGVVGEHFMGRSIKQLRRQQGVVWPSVLSSLAGSGADKVGRVIVEEGLAARCREYMHWTGVVWIGADVPSQKIDKLLLAGGRAGDVVWGEGSHFQGKASSRPVAWESTVLLKETHYRFVDGPRRLACLLACLLASELVDKRLRDVVAGARRSVGRLRSA